MTAPTSLASTVRWLDQRTVGCSSDATEEVAKAAGLAAGMPSQETEAPITLIAPSKFEDAIKAHLDWWGFQMKAIRSKDSTTAWEVRPA